MKKPLTVECLKAEAGRFSKAESRHHERTLYGVTDGKAVGTYLEHKFRKYLQKRFAFEQGNAAQGIDFPSLGVDLKVTSIRQPQSSCPYKSARQKIYGLGYGLLVFVYEKTDSRARRTGNLKILHTIFVEPDRTGDFQMTRRLRDILENKGNKDDLIACMTDHNLPMDEIKAAQLAGELLKRPPPQGYLTISNALQWRLQYSRIVQEAGKVPGVVRLD